MSSLISFIYSLMQSMSPLLISQPLARLPPNPLTCLLAQLRRQPVSPKLAGGVEPSLAATGQSDLPCRVPSHTQPIPPQDRPCRIEARGGAGVGRDNGQHKPSSFPSLMHGARRNKSCPLYSGETEALSAATTCPESHNSKGQSWGRI